MVANEPGTVNVAVTRALVGSSPATDVAWFPTDATDYT